MWSRDGDNLPERARKEEAMGLEWLIEMWKEEAAERKAKGLDWRSGEEKRSETEKEP